MNNDIPLDVHNVLRSNSVQSGSKQREVSPWQVIPPKFQFGQTYHWEDLGQGLWVKPLYPFHSHQNS